MPTWNYHGPWLWYVAWNAIAFVGAFVVNSFIENLTHRVVMHRLFRLIPYGYEHTTSHHAVFGSGETYHATQPWMLAHGIGFTWREYLLFPIFCSALYIPIELIVGRPLYIGALAAVFFGLIAFDTLHRRFHNPRDTWFQRSGLFLFLKKHHRIHHEDMTRNLNVVFPLADLVLGTLVTRKK
jgi:hypothetical protein